MLTRLCLFSKAFANAMAFQAKKYTSTAQPNTRQYFWQPYAPQVEAMVVKNNNKKGVSKDLYPSPNSLCP